VFELTQFWDALERPVDVPLVHLLFLIDEDAAAQQLDVVLEEHTRWVEHEQHLVESLLRLWRQGQQDTVNALLNSAERARTYAALRLERANVERRALERVVGEGSSRLTFRDLAQFNGALIAWLERERKHRR